MEIITFNRAIKYEVYPTDEQKELIIKTFGCVRFLYNQCLELQDGLYQAGMGFMSKFDLINYCTRQLKPMFPFLKEVDKFALNSVVLNLDRAYKNFFKKLANYPKFKSKKQNENSYTTSCCHRNVEIKGNQIKLPKLGWIKASICRKPKPDWILKQATVSMTSSGKFYISILFAFTKEVFHITPTLDNTLGLDYSSPNFYVDSNGYKPKVPHPFKRIENRLVREQRKLSHMKQGSHNYNKQKQYIAKLYAKATNQRKDFCHQQSRKIANSYDAVCVEDLDLQALSQTLRLGKATMDNGFGMFRIFLEYKLKEQGKHFVKIDKWYASSKICHHCGTHNPNLKLGESEWTCPVCGIVIDRDFNAAINIRNEGFRLLTA